MEATILYSLAAFLISTIFIQVYKPAAERVGLSDTPSQRKQHLGTVPIVGGIAIYSALFLMTVISQPELSTSWLFLLCSFPLVFVGVIDDIKSLSVKARAVTQITASLLMCYVAHLKIDFLGDLFGTGDIYLGTFAVLFTTICMVGTINAFNMTDGIDGLCSGLTIVTLTFLYAIGYSNGFTPSIDITVFIFCLLAYMSFNLQVFGKRFDKIFMGDAGSMLIGFAVVWLMIEYTQGPEPQFSPMVSVWLISIPLMDMAAVMWRRIRAGKSPLHPDRDHIHHILIRAGLSPRRALIVILALSTLMSSIGYGLYKLGVSDWVLFYLWWALFVFYARGLSRVFVQDDTLNAECR